MTRPPFPSTTEAQPRNVTFLTMKTVVRKIQKNDGQTGSCAWTRQCFDQGGGGQYIMCHLSDCLREHVHPTHTIQGFGPRRSRPNGLTECIDTILHHFVPCGFPAVFSVGVVWVDSVCCISIVLAAVLAQPPLCTRSLPGTSQCLPLLDRTPGSEIKDFVWLWDDGPVKRRGLSHFWGLLLSACTGWGWCWRHHPLWVCLGTFRYNVGPDDTSWVASCVGGPVVFIRSSCTALKIKGSWPCCGCCSASVQEHTCAHLHVLSSSKLPGHTFLAL